MNDIDKEWYKHLNALSTIFIDTKYGKYSVNVTKKFGKYMKGDTWNDLHKLGYVSINPEVESILTPKGMEQLRMLEDIRRKDLTLTLSIIAIIISIVALAKSMGWI